MSLTSEDTREDTGDDATPTSLTPPIGVRGEGVVVLWSPDPPGRGKDGDGRTERRLDLTAVVVAGGEPESQRLLLRFRKTRGGRLPFRRWLTDLVLSHGDALGAGHVVDLDDAADQIAAYWYVRWRASVNGATAPPPL